MATFLRIVQLLFLISLPLFPIQESNSYMTWGLGLYCGIFLLVSLFRGLKKELITVPVVIFFVYILFLSFLSFGSPESQRSFQLILLTISAFLSFIFTPILFAKEVDRKRLIGVFIFLSCLLSIISLYSTFFLNYVNKDHIGTSLMWIYFGHNHLGAYLIMVLPLTFYLLQTLWSQKIWRIVLITALIVMVQGLIASYSRGSIISLAMATLIGFWFYPKWQMKQKLVVTGFLLISITVSLFLTTSFASLNKVKKDFSLQNIRLTYWHIAIEEGIKNPVFGAGLMSYHQSEGQKDLKLSQRSPYVHNSLLQVFAETGFFGLVLLMALLSSLFYTIGLALKTTNLSKRLFVICLFVSLLGSFLNSLVDYDWQLPTIFILFWTLASLGVEIKEES